MEVGAIQMCSSGEKLIIAQRLIPTTSKGRFVKKNRRLECFYGF